MNFNNLTNNINYIPENNWSVVSEKTDIWPGSLPFGPGDVFPTESVKERATISKTNKMIYENDVDEIYSNIISIFPEIDPMYGWQIREIVTHLPYFKNATNSWVSLIVGESPLIDINDDVDIEFSTIISESNFVNMLQNEVRSRFLDVISAYRVELDLNNKPHISMIEAKNLICYVNKEKLSSIEVNVVFSIYEKNGKSYIDFVEYHYDGYIKKSTFEYNNGTIGNLIDEEESEAFNGNFKASPVVVFKHNATGNDIYGTDQYRYWSASMLAGMRELQNVLRLGERTREMMRKVPEGAIKKSPIDGSSTFYNKGTISYPEGSNNEHSPDLEYVVPEVRMQEAVEALKRAIFQIGMDTQLGTAFYDLSSLGARLSAESIRASMFQAELESRRINTEMKKPVIDLIVRLCYLYNYDVDRSKIVLNFYGGFPEDEKTLVKNIQERLNSDIPSITLQDAVATLDKLTIRAAKEKVEELRKEKPSEQNNQELENINSINQEKETTDEDIDPKIKDIEDSGKYVEEHGIEEDESILKPNGGHYSVDNNVEYLDDTVWENQMIPKPRDIPQGVEYKSKKEGGLREWIKALILKD